jgi:hypothetical protein
MADFTLEDGSGSILLEGSAGYMLLESGVSPAVMRVQAVAPGFYQGDYKDIGDVFDIFNMSDFCSSTVSLVPLGNPAYPLYGWMLQVPSTTPLFSWAAYGNSSPKSSFQRYVV